eukprot:6249988-Prymnesium_polylepis.1
MPPRSGRETSARIVCAPKSPCTCTPYRQLYRTEPNIPRPFQSVTHMQDHAYIMRHHFVTPSWEPLTSEPTRESLDV